MGEVAWRLGGSPRPPPRAGRQGRAGPHLPRTFAARRSCPASALPSCAVRLCPSCLRAESSSGAPPVASSLRRGGTRPRRPPWVPYNLCGRSKSHLRNGRAKTKLQAARAAPALLPAACWWVGADLACLPRSSPPPPSPYSSLRPPAGPCGPAHGRQWPRELWGQRALGPEASRATAPARQWCGERPICPLAGASGASATSAATSHPLATTHSPLPLRQTPMDRQRRGRGQPPPLLQPPASSQERRSSGREPSSSTGNGGSGTATTYSPES